MHRRGYLAGVVGTAAVAVGGCLGRDERTEFQIDRNTGGCHEEALVDESVAFDGQAAPDESTVQWRVELEPGEVLEVSVVSDNEDETEVEWPWIVVLDPAEDPLLEIENAVENTYRPTAETAGFHTIRVGTQQLVSATRWDISLTWYSSPACT